MNINENSYCPCCEQAHLRIKVEDKEFEYNGRILVMDGYTSYLCVHCNAEFPSRETFDKFSPIMREFVVEVDEGLLN